MASIAKKSELSDSSCSSWERALSFSQVIDPPGEFDINHYAIGDGAVLLRTDTDEIGGYQSWTGDTGTIANDSADTLEYRNYVIANEADQMTVDADFESILSAAKLGIAKVAMPVQPRSLLKLWIAVWPRIQLTKIILIFNAIIKDFQRLLSESKENLKSFTKNSKERNLSAPLCTHILNL